MNFLLSHNFLQAYFFSSQKITHQQIQLVIKFKKTIFKYIYQIFIAKLKGLSSKLAI